MKTVQTTMRTCRRPGREGGALPLVMGIVVVLTLVGAGLLGTAASSRLDAIKRQQSLQCFWGAESVLALARFRLFTDPDYRTTPADIALTNGRMRAAAHVSRAGNIFSVEACGSNTINRLSRSIAQDFSLQQYGYWDDFALFSGVDGADLAQSVVVYGDVFCEGDMRMAQAAAIFESLFCQGDLSMSQSAAIYDEAFIGGTISLKQASVIYGGSYPFSSPANPYYIVQPQVPALDPSYYNSLIAQTATQDSGVNFDNSINLAGQILFVQGSASLKSTKTLTSTPPGGILVVQGSFDIQQSCQIGSGVTVICGDSFAMGQSTRVGSNTLVYAGSRIDMKQSGIVATRCSLVTPGIVQMMQAAQASGYVYAGNVVNLSQSTVIRGIVFSGKRAELSQSVYLYYDPTRLPFSVPPGIQTTDAVVMTPQRWREL